MNLRTQAAADLKKILSDTAAGFAIEATVINPDGVTKVIPGLFQDISELIDPASGVSMSGTQVTITFPTAVLTEQGFGMPQGISEKQKKPWQVIMPGANGPRNFKIAESRPDEIGSVVCFLENYKP